MPMVMFEGNLTKECQTTMASWTTQDKIIKNKLGVLRLAETLGNVSQACKLMGYSRDSF